MTREEYLSQRLKIRPSEFWADMDHWPLFAGTQNIDRYLYIASLLERVKDVSGQVGEFGIWRGSLTCFLAKRLRQTAKQVRAFEWFAGFSEAIRADKDLRSNYQGNQEELAALLELEGLRDKVIIHDGDICETVPALLAQDATLRFSLVYVDCDVLEPCRAALELAHARLNSGGLIVLDEYGFEAWPGETQATDEFLDAYPNCYRRELTPVPQPSLVLVRQ